MNDAEPGPAHRHADDRGDPGARARVGTRRRASAPGRRSCASASPRPRSGSTPIRTSSPAACASASRSRSRSCTGRRCSSPTSRRRRSTSPSRRRSSPRCRALAAETGTAMLWITHDLSVIAGLADRIAVMYAGRIVETGSVVDVLERPIHPYTGGPDRLGAEPQQARRAAGADPRHDALAREAAAGLPVLAALPARDRHLPQHDAGRDALRRRPHGALPSSARRRAAGGVTRMSAPIIELDGVSKRFVKPLDAAEKIANLFGAGLSDAGRARRRRRQPHDRARARSSASSANRAAASRRSAASSPASSTRAPASCASRAAPARRSRAPSAARRSSPCR